MERILKAVLLGAVALRYIVGSSVIAGNQRQL
jgi:hypothetical protein